jgi:hypothetical protein
MTSPKECTMNVTPNPKHGKRTAQDTPSKEISSNYNLPHIFPTSYTLHKQEP